MQSNVILYFNLALGPDARIPTVFPKPPFKPDKEEKTTTEPVCSCDGEDGREKTKFSDSDAEQLIQFEDELHNTVYVR